MSVYRDKSRGKIVWRYRKVVKLADGRRVRVSGTPQINTKAAAEKAERVHIERVLNPPAEPRKAIPTVADYFKTFEASLAGKKPSYQSDTRHIFRTHIRPVFGTLKLDAVKQTHVDRFRGAQLRQGFALKTINNRLSVLKRLLKHAAQNDIIPIPKLSTWSKYQDAEIVAVSAADFDKVLAAATDERYRVALLLAYDAGLRAGEIRGIQWGDVDEVNRELHVRRALDRDSRKAIATKGWRMRSVPMSDRLLAALRALTERGPWVISALDGSALTAAHVSQVGRSMYEAANVERPPKPWHCLRHSFCSELAAAGVPVPVIRELAGHEDINTTMGYVHTNKAQKHAAIARRSKMATTCQPKEGAPETNVISAPFGATPTGFEPAGKNNGSE